MDEKKLETRIKALNTEVKNLKEKLKDAEDRAKTATENRNNMKMLMAKQEKNRHLIEWRLKNREKRRNLDGRQR